MVGVQHVHAPVAEAVQARCVGPPGPSLGTRSRSINRDVVAGASSSARGSGEDATRGIARHALRYTFSELPCSLEVLLIIPVRAHPMIASEARAARLALELSEVALAVETNTTPAAVAAWEDGRIEVPRRVAIDLTWRIARIERVAALAASGLAECSWVPAFEAEPVPRKIEAQTAHFERLLEHNKTCDLCRARQAFIAERFGPMPPAPRHGWMVIVMPIVERLRRLPPRAQPAVIGAILFAVYTLVRVIFELPTLVRGPFSGLLTAITAVLVSASLGAVLGFFYGLYRRARTRESARPAA